MHRSKHAQEIAQRFREMVEGAGDSLPAEHYDELILLIEAAIDTAKVEMLETISARLNKLSEDLIHDAEFFD